MLSQHTTVAAWSAGRLVLTLGFLVATLAGCASPTRPDPDGAVVTGAPPAESSAGSAPRFAADGPNAEDYGAPDGYPIGDRATFYNVPFFVGAFSHFDQIFESRMIRRAATPSRLPRAPAEPALALQGVDEEQAAGSLAVWGL